MSEIDKSYDAVSAPWLEIIDGDAPILLIAPHGGRAGPASRSLLNPKVNDLHTAAITRELATLLHAPALINASMDRNYLDLNRLKRWFWRTGEQISAWFQLLYHRFKKLLLVGSFKFV